MSGGEGAAAGGRRTGPLSPGGRATLPQDRLPGPPAGGEGQQPSLAVDALGLERWNLADREPAAHRPEVEHRLDLEAARVDLEVGENAGPESVVAVAEIGETDAEEQPNHPDERLVAPAA